MESQFLEFLLLEEVQFAEVNDDADDLLQWELVDVFDAQVLEDSSVSSPNNGQIEEIRSQPDADVSVDAKLDRRHFADDVNDERYVLGFDERQVDDEDDEEEDDGYGLDDELVPWNVGNKLGRQRMRKLGKRAFSRMNNSKRSPYLFVRPGCVRGKHGLGLKHSITD